MTENFRIRRATVQDAEIIAWHRARMFQDMGELSADGVEILRAKATARIREWLEQGKYLGWLATAADKPETVIAGAGLQLQPILPRPLGPEKVGEGKQGTVVNVFTEPGWRRKGIASRLIKEIIDWCRGENLDRLLLHASLEGRAVYEKLGFVQSNEMRFIDKTNQ
jgi:GNAT superfamily N-acetyltransferase